MIALSSPWDTMWRRLDAIFQQSAAQIRAVHPQVSWTSGHHATEGCPLTAFASFSRTGHPKNEDIVISVSARTSGNILLLASDVARGEGYVLADGPSATYPADIAPDVLSEQEVVLVTEIDTFLHEYLDVILSELRPLESH